MTNRKSAIVLATVIIGLVCVGLYFLYNLKNRQLEIHSNIAVLGDLETNGIRSRIVKDINGAQVDFRSFKGKLIILNFWATWCGPCVEELPSLIKLIKEFKNEVVVIAISEDSSESEIKDFLLSFKDFNHESSIFVALDHDKAIMKEYDVSKLPESFIFGKDLLLVKKVAGSINWYTPDSIEYIKSLLKK